MIKALFYLLLLVLISGTSISAQENQHEIDLDVGSAIGVGEFVPFWFFSNQNSILDNTPFNFYSRVGYKKPFTKDRNLDFSGGIRLVNRVSDHYSLYPEEAYGIFRFYFLDIQAGRVRETFGNQNDNLSSGGLLWSGNALPLPKIAVLTPDYVNVPFTKGYLQFKGGISHGWFGENRFVKNALLHHKYIYAKAGGDFPVNLSIGMHHFAQWGGTSSDPEYGKLPSNLKSLRRVFFASGGGSESPVPDQENAEGNHLGSYNLGADIELPSINIGLYWQSIFEDNSGRTNRNLWDGLYGISVNLDQSKFINSILFELLLTTYQSGAPEPDASPPIHTDNYFNNWLYRSGWSYRNMTIGTPLITSPALTNDLNNYDFFSNNRVRAFHSGIMGETFLFEYKLLYTYSLNYGTYYTPFNSIKEQHFLFLDFIFRDLFKSTDLAIGFGIDWGELVGNNYGIQFNIARKILL